MIGQTQTEGILSNTSFLPTTGMIAYYMDKIKKDSFKNFISNALPIFTSNA